MTACVSAKKCGSAIDGCRTLKREVQSSDNETFYVQPRRRKITKKNRCRHASNQRMI